jgi:DNA-binding NarL/FixJ family response regulator
MISVLLVDDQANVLNILLYLLEEADDIQVLATASSGREAMTQATSNCPDIVVMDVSMPGVNGIEAARQILLVCPLARVLMLSIFDSQEYIHRALDVGARGYILKEKASRELLTGIRTLFSGEHFFSQKIAGIAEKHLREKGNDSWAA